jgi:hypothetical protein
VHENKRARFAESVQAGVEKEPETGILAKAGRPPPEDRPGGKKRAANRFGMIRVCVVNAKKNSTALTWETHLP